MALTVSLLGQTNLQAVVSLINFIRGTTLDPNWVGLASVAGSPYHPRVNVTIAAITVPNGNGDAPLYTGTQSIFYNRVGFQQAFSGWNLRIRLVPPFTYAQLLAAIKTQYGIVLEQTDLQNDLSTTATIDLFDNVNLIPGSGSARFYVDFSPFNIVVNINPTAETELDRLVNAANQANMADLDALHIPPGYTYPPGTPLLDS